MKIAIITAFNERPQVSQILLNCIDRLRKETDHLITLFAACHDMDDFQTVTDYDGNAILCDENIASNKFNDALLFAIRRRYDAYLIMGDDDSISSEYVEQAVEYLESGYDYVGMKHNGYYELSTGNAMIHRYEQQTHKLIGAGRMISAQAIDQVCIKSRVKVQRDFNDDFVSLRKGDTILMNTESAQYLYRMGYVNIMDSDVYCPLWKEGLMRSLDHTSEMRMVLEGFAPTSISAGKVHVTDFKSSVNIWPYSILEDKCSKATFADVTWFMDDKEKEYINSMRNQ